MNLHLTVRQANDVTVVEPAGRITLGESGTSLYGLFEKLRDHGHEQVLVNLAGVTLVDSAGLGVLISGYTSIMKRGGRIKFSSPNDYVLRLFKMTGVDGVFEVYEDENTALASFSA